MNWPAQIPTRTDPAYYADAESAAEAELRADFAHHYQLRLIAAYGETPADKIRMYRDAHRLADKWASHERSDMRTLWRQLQGAVAGWEARPHATARAFDRVATSGELGGVAVDGMVWRTLVQACDITGHGPEPTAGSEQDAARTPARAAHLEVVADADATPILDRAFGRGFLERPAVDPGGDAIGVEAIAERAGEQAVSGAGAESIVSGPEPQTLDPSVFGEALARRQIRQIDALRRLQNATAEHSRLADEWGPEVLFGGRILRLEQLLDQGRAARRDAARAGVSTSEIDQTYRAGLTGVSWHERPGHLLLGRIDHLSRERDRMLGRTEPGAEDSRVGLDIDAAITAAAPPTGYGHGDWDSTADSIEADPVTCDRSLELS
ncbi:hypothetical protein [Nocardia carnea]|uniref:hypothetical protein n=1 Tax=Nocardia carnea TaxID=37328 RepID=UPI0024572E89|nr:hypothetical protein [Nocardia carnea]